MRYAEPIEVSWPLGVSPRLESWDTKTAPSQIALGNYLDHVEAAARPRMIALSDAPLSLRLFVGLERGVDALTGGRDLDNYLFPILRRLGPSRFVSVWAAKGFGESVIGIERAVPARVSLGRNWQFASAATTASTQKTAWKEQIGRQIAEQAHGIALGAGVELEICFRARPEHNWSLLWKPAIDSLECILGSDRSARPYHPQDDRIVRLGLHRMDDSTLGWDVLLGVWWRSAEPVR